MPERDQDQEEYDFIKEKIKRKPLDKRRILCQILFVIFLAFLFGVVASYTFTAVLPYMQKWAYGRSKIEIPIDDGEEQEEPEASDKAEEEQDEKAIDEPQEVVPQTEIIYETKELELADYQKLQTQLFEIGKTANRSVVTVTGLSSMTDWFDTSYETTDQSSGIIIAQTDTELLILTEHKAVDDAKEIEITFSDNEMVIAQMKKYDGNTGLAVISVPITSIKKETLDAISVIRFGNSARCKLGEVVLAIGSPLGSNFSVLTGNITSTENIISTNDYTYNVFTTNMVGSSQGSGALINTEGEMIGIVMQDYRNSDDEGTLTAIAITTLKDIIERLSNGKNVQYLGVKVSTVTDVIAKENDIPRGVYVKSVADDSPAMAAGIQNGDVIVKMNDEEIKDISQYENVLKAAEAGNELKIVVKRLGSNGYSDIECAATVGVLE